MAVILLVLGALAGLIAARAVKGSSPPVPSMAIEEARKIRESVSASPAAAVPAPGAQPRRRWPPRTRRPRREELMAQRSPGEIRSSIESNRMELAVSVDRLRGEVTHLTDWRGHVERHQRELAIGAAVVGLVLTQTFASP